MTIGQIIQRVQSLYSKGVQSDDTRLTTRHIYSKLISARAVILLQQVKKKNKISDWSYQEVSFSLASTSALSVPANVPDGYIVKATTTTVPAPITSTLMHSIDWVMSGNGAIKLDETNRNELLHISGNRYTKGKSRYMIYKDYIYVFGVEALTSIVVRMLAEDPLEVYAINLAGTNYDIFSLEFPLEEALVDVVIELATKELVESFRLQTEDFKNDSRDEEPKR